MCIPCSIDARDAICLDLLLRLLYPRGLPKNEVFVKTFEVSIHYTGKFAQYFVLRSTKFPVHYRYCTARPAKGICGAWGRNEGPLYSGIARPLGMGAWVGTNTM